MSLDLDPECKGQTRVNVKTCVFMNIINITILLNILLY